MAGSKEIRNKIKSVQSTRKITKAMEMVAASKMKKAQDRMRAVAPVRRAAASTSRCTSRRRTPSTGIRSWCSASTVKRVGAIVVTTDKGLCGGLNTNVLRLVLQRTRNGGRKGIDVDYVAIGNKGLGFLSRLGGNVVSSVVQLGDRPQLDRLVGPVKVLIDKYIDGSDRRDAHLLHELRQHDEAGAAARPHHADPDQYRTPTGEVRTARRRRRARGTTSTSPTRASCSTA